ncbi:hypothetical protein EJ05DRAFT_490653 [Pseudovirgaria hyperparasitica]|uniref:Zn(2)-C6 fungal-type domain-containing protein n=1 Tax=Pseudovirgaria hyperparasitica TaxID=470096 RepID=A0A6A6VQ59_9PEZI|nr:uncharacterized protein EJ05DRAFT_490653 [Pseudovirgaria hyperparasitica]KAF2752752.1 hypothetical protein EJ05DRAFT_490653 [Pseudovirgaria hyperparasitica]
MSSLAPQCWSCRRRRVRCDSEKPACLKCQVKGIECPGYGDTKPLVWIKGPNARKKRRKVDAHQTSGESLVSAEKGLTYQHAHHLERTLTLQEKFPAGSKGIWADAAERRQKAEGTVQEFGSQYFPPKLANLVRCMEYYNRFLCGTMSPIVSECNPFRIKACFWHFTPPILLDMFFLVVARHRFIRETQSRTRFEWTEHVRSLENDISKHTFSAVTQLNQRLSEPKTQKEMITLICVFILMISEVQRCSVGKKWKAHFQGARAIVDLHGGMKIFLRSEEYAVRNLMTYLILIETMRLTTSNIHKEPLASEQKQYLSYVPSLYNDGVWTVMPCSHHLLTAIMRTNDLRARRYTASLPELAVIQLEARKLFIELNAFDPKQWADAAVIIQDLAPKMKQTEWNTRLLSWPLPKESVERAVGTKERDAKMWLCLGHVYLSAVILFLLRSLLLPIFGPNTIVLPDSVMTIQQFRIEHLRKLLMNIDMLFATRNTNIPFYLYCFWPMVIAGLEISGKDKASKTMIRNRLHDMSVILGFHSMIDASEFLERYWARGSPVVDTSVAWDEIWDNEDPCLFVL